MKFFILLFALCGIAYGNENPKSELSDLDGQTRDPKTLNWNNFDAEKDIAIELIKQDGSKIAYKGANRTQIEIEREWPTTIFIHGYTAGNMHELMKEAYFGGPDKAKVNLIRINWKDGASHIAYPESAARVKQVGEYVAQFIAEIVPGKISVERITLVGHSLGAQCAGFAGRIVQPLLLKKGIEKKIPVIVGLDPARPGFEIPFHDLELNGLKESDAVKVLAIHTNPGGFGYLKKIGTVDIYFKYNNETEHSKECGKEKTLQNALATALNGDIFDAGQNVIQFFGLEVVNNVANFFKVFDSNTAHICDHGFVNIFFRDVIKASRKEKVSGVDYSEPFELIAEYSRSIPNAIIINKEGDNCQPGLKDGLLKWKKNCTNEENGVVKSPRPSV